MKKIILATLGMGLLVIGVNANAVGQGGIAGSASMRLNTTGAANIVTHVSSSIAIGKQSAYTGAAGSSVAATPATTFATGASGTMVIDETTSQLISVSEDPTLATAQANVMHQGIISLDGTATDGKFKGEAK